VERKVPRPDAPKSALSAGSWDLRRVVTDVGERRPALVSDWEAVSWIGSRWTNIPSLQEYQLDVFVSEGASGGTLYLLRTPTEGDDHGQPYQEPETCRPPGTGGRTTHVHIAALPLPTGSTDGADREDDVLQLAGVELLIDRGRSATFWHTVWERLLGWDIAAAGKGGR
jgi:hypothetical protein